MSLENKSVTELRGMAQAFGVPDIFGKTAAQLRDAIEARTEKMAAEALPPIPERLPYDARLLITHKDKTFQPTALVALLERHILTGLSLRFDEESWHMSYRGMTDCGSLRMPIRHAYAAAEKLMNARAK